MIALNGFLPARLAILPAFLFAVLVLAGPGCGRRSTNESPASASSTSPRELLRQMAETYQSATSYEDVGELHILPENGQQDESKPFAVAFERPNKVRIHSLGAMVVADGQTLRAVAPSLDEQVLVRPCERLSLADLAADEMLIQAMRGQIDVGLPQLTLLLDRDADRTLTAGCDLEQLSDAEFQGETCHRVAARGSDGTAVFWISADSHLLRKFEFPMHALREKFPLAAVWVDLRGARTGRSISPLAFQMEVPASAKLVKQFIMPPPDAPPPLLSQVAADFAFVGLDGTTVSRESLAGKIVVLDLWATWCGWCFEGLPLLETVYQQYKDDDRIAFLAVSRDETVVSNERVRQAFDERKLTIPIVRDMRLISDTVFQVQAMPTGIILGADGSVQDYHVGYDPNLTVTLPEKLEKLLAGQNLAQQELEAYRRREQEYRERLSEVLVDTSTSGEAEVARTPAAAR